MSKPTDAEIKEFWEYFIPERIEANRIVEGLPEIPVTLDNLFKYAVPKLIGDYKYTLSMRTDVDFNTRENLYIFRLSSDPLVIDAEVEDKDPALALFRAIQEVIR